MARKRSLGGSLLLGSLLRVLGCAAAANAEAFARGTATASATVTVVASDSVLEADPQPLQYMATGLTVSISPGLVIIGPGPPAPVGPSAPPAPPTVPPAQLPPPIAEVRQLTITFLDSISRNDAALTDYIINRLAPAAQSVLGRSIRVRNPSGPLIFVGQVDRQGDVIPNPPPLTPGGVTPGWDSDLVVKVLTTPTTNCAFVARAGAFVLEEGTNRPTFGDLEYCDVNPADFNFDLTITVHEILHILGVTRNLFDFYPGYPAGFPTGTTGGEAPSLILQSPQVRSQTRTFFDCPTAPGGEFENSGGPGISGAHWEERIFSGVLMDPVFVGRSLQTHFNRHVLTDLTLSLLQDSNWYDVKYGSAGFNSYGYRGGCGFATGSFPQALASPAAAQYLCPAVSDARLCQHDQSGSGVCSSQRFANDFLRVVGLTTALDCQSTPGQRCLRPLNADPTCVDMSCSATGAVLVGGVPCDPTQFACPDANAMCGDPGFLTCRATLNDCSGVGDCFRGRCFCHAGWGGDDCSVPVCIGQCPNGSPCPPSGFCGVPSCGSFSSGSSNKGSACNPPRTSGVPTLPPPVVPPPSADPPPSTDPTGPAVIVTLPGGGGSTTPPSNPPPPSDPTTPPGPVVIDTPPFSGGGSSSTPDCGAGSACVRNNRQCAGIGFDFSQACCDGGYECVKRNEGFSQCRKIGAPLLSTWNGTALPCGTPPDG
eukprot:jgi/Ulvmu1/5872/UM025_0134.1